MFTYTKISRQITHAAFALALALGFGANARAVAADKVTWVYADTLDSVIPQIGAAQGIFRKHNIEMDFVHAATGPAMIAAVVSGSADVTHAGSALAFPAILKGAPLVILSGNYDIDFTVVAQTSLAVDTKLPYPQWALALKGKRIGISARGGVTELLVRKIVSDAGMDPERDVSWIAIGTAASSVAAFVNNQVDAMVGIPPSNEMLGIGKYVMLCDVSCVRGKAFTVDYLHTAIEANRKFVESRPDVALRFCKGVKETMDFVGDPANTDAFAAFLIKKMGIDNALALAMVKANRANYSYTLTEDRWNHMKALVAAVPDFATNTFAPCVALSK